MKTIKMTVHHGNNRNSITATGETLADAIKQLLAQPLGSYAIDESREGYPIIMRELETDGKASWGWGDYEVIEEPTPKSYQQITVDSTTDRAVGGDTAPDDQINGFLWGFSKGANIDRSEAPAQWAGHSIQLGDSERQAIERQGKDAGFTEGQQFAKLYDTAPVSPAHTPEPWCISTSGERILGVETPDDQPIIASFCGAACEDQEGAANIRRAVACVNACAGMTDPAAEIKALRDALENCCRQVEFTKYDFPPEILPEHKGSAIHVAWEAARAALAIGGEKEGK